MFIPFMYGQGYWPKKETCFMLYSSVLYVIMFALDIKAKVIQ